MFGMASSCMAPDLGIPAGAEISGLDGRGPGALAGTMDIGAVDFSGAPGIRTAGTGIPGFMLPECTTRGTVVCYTTDRLRESQIGQAQAVGVSTTAGKVPQLPVVIRLRSIREEDLGHVPWFRRSGRQREGQISTPGKTIRSIDIKAMVGISATARTGRRSNLRTISLNN